MKKAIGIVALVVSLLITIYVVRNITGIGIAESTENWTKVAVFFSLMLLGMLAREAYNALTSGKPFNWTSLAIGAIVSPMVFGAVYSTFGALNIDVPTVVLAFQNGFFWNSIFAGLGPRS